MTKPKEDEMFICPKVKKCSVKALCKHKEKHNLDRSCGEGYYDCKKPLCIPVEKKEEKVCERCKGTGRIPDIENPIIDNRDGACRSLKAKDCPACDGTGKQPEDRVSKNRIRQLQASLRILYQSKNKRDYPLADIKIEQFIQQLTSEIENRVRGEIIKIIDESASIQLLSNQGVSEQLAWCEGRNKLRKELKQKLKQER